MHSGWTIIKVEEDKREQNDEQFYQLNLEKSSVTLTNLGETKIGLAFVVCDCDKLLLNRRSIE